MSSSVLRLYEPLAPYAGNIAGSADRQSAVPYVESTWRGWLAQAGVEDEVADAVFAAIGAKVNRSEIRTMASDCESASGRLALLIAVLVWGRGRRNGRMRDSIIKVLTNANRDEILLATRELALAGDPAGAYRAWKLPGLQAAFFTKWLWAASSLNAENCCLVQDRLVWKSLRALGWDSKEAAGGTRNRDVRYAAYVRDLHECARRLSRGLGDEGAVTGEDVEHVLFSAKGDFNAWVNRLPSADGAV